MWLHSSILFAAEVATNSGWERNMSIAGARNKLMITWVYRATPHLLADAGTCLLYLCARDTVLEVLE